MKDAVAVFNEWAELDKDLGMERGHADAVTEMLDFALKERHRINKNFTFLDLGCGNGWVVRKVIDDPLCKTALGIDGADQMIANAKARGNKEDYILANIHDYEPQKKFDLIHSMEVLYYLEDPESILKKISNSWLAKEGRLIAGIDLYYENRDSHSWEEKVGTKMLMLQQAEWIEMFESAGFSNVESWRANQTEGWAGTLVLTGRKN
jgi:trans-aconitate methyltransferase